MRSFLLFALMLQMCLSLSLKFGSRPLSPRVIASTLSAAELKRSWYLSGKAVMGLDDELSTDLSKPVDLGPFHISIKGKTLTLWGLLTCFVLTFSVLAIFPFVVLVATLADITGSGKVRSV